MGLNLALIGILIVIVLQVISLQRPTSAPATGKEAAAGGAALPLSAEVQAYIDSRNASAVDCVTDDQIKKLLEELARRDRLIADLEALRAQLPKPATAASLAPNTDSLRILEQAREREISIFRGKIAQECAVPPSGDAPASRPAAGTSKPAGKSGLGKPIFRQNTEDKP